MSAHEWALVIGGIPLSLLIVWIVCMVFYIAWSEAGVLGILAVLGYVGCCALVFFGVAGEIR